MTTSAHLATEDATVVIYIATNSVNEKRYIGVTRQKMAARARGHFNKAKAGSRYRFHAAIRKYGRGEFTFSVLETLSDYKEALKREMFYISSIGPEYNVTAGGEGVHGLLMSEDTRRKIAEANQGNTIWLGRKHREDSVEKMRISHLGNTNAKGKRSPEAIERMRAAQRKNPTRYWLGKSRSQATKDKISASNKGKPNPSAKITLERTHQLMIEAAAKLRRKPIVCLNDGMIFSCAKEVAAHYGLSNHRHLYQAINRGTSLRDLGLKFTYEDVV